MKFGINTFIWTASFEKQHLPLLGPIKEQGFDVVELTRFEWDHFPAADIRRELERLDLGVTFCTAFGSRELSLVSDDASVRQAALTFMKRAIENVAEIGCQVLAGPFHSPVGYLPGRRRTGSEWAREVDALRELGEVAARANVKLAVEPLNRFESYFLNTAADAARLCDEVNHPNIGVLYDTFHANIEEKDQYAAIHSVSRHLVHVHSCENDRGAPGSGHVEWPKVFQALREIGYQGALVIESFGFAIPEIAAAACIWRDLAPTPESIAWDGLRFLRSC
jgi:D-psicose/D-tagatose/L-ribulose 3-epimerase